MKITSSRQFTGKALVLIWILLCLFFYIELSGKVSYTHWSTLGNWAQLELKLERLNPLSDLLHFIWSFTGTLFFSVSCASLGIFVMGKAKINNASSSPMIFTSPALLATGFLIGHGIFSLLFLTLAGLYELIPAYTVFLLFIGFLLGVRQTVNNVKQIFTEMYSKFGAIPRNKWNQMSILLPISILLTTLQYSTARISYDSSALYFSDAKLTALNNQIAFFTENSFVTSAFQNMIQYSVLIQLFGDQSARLFSWVCGIVFILFSLAVGERLGISKHAMAILVMLLITSTAFLDLMGDGKVDLISSVPAMAAVYWIITDGQIKTPQKSIQLLVGSLVGLAIIARPFNVFLLGLPVILFYLQRRYLKNGFEPLSHWGFIHSMLYIGVPIFGMVLYHLYANWMILGDPFAFLLSISKIDPSTGPWDYNPDTILTARLLYPFTITFYNTPQTLGNISPLFIAFLPALLFQDIREKLRLSRKLRVLWITALITLLLWIFVFFTVYEIRYVLFLWAIVFMPVAETIDIMLENENRTLQKVLRAVIIGLLAFTIVKVVYISIDTYSPIDAQGNPTCSDSRFCEYLKPINEAASPGDRVLMLGAFRYYLRNDLFACSTRHTEYRTLQELTSQNPEAFWEEVYRQGYKYVAYENDYTTRHLQFAFIPSPSSTPAWIELEPIFGMQGDLQVAYRINVTNPPIEVEAICKKDPQMGWEIHHLGR